MGLIIQDIMEKIIKTTEKNLSNMLSERRDISEFICDTRLLLDEIGVNIVKDALETIDEVVKIDGQRKNEWYVERSDEKTISTEFGDVTYMRTYYKNKHTKEYKHLSDEIIGIQPHERMDTGLKAKLIESAAHLSYNKSGKITTANAEFSDQTVMNCIRTMGAIPNDAVKFSSSKKVVPIIYIEADEDHVANQIGSCIEPKLIYVHEGIKEVSEGRRKLINTRYFSGVYSKSEDIWLEVANYIENVYDLDSVDKIFISGDGARWIKEGLNWIKGSTYALDKFHLKKYLRKATVHLPHTYPVMWNYIENEEREFVCDLFNEILDNTENEFKREEIKESKRYVINHWDAILVNFDEDYIGCSAEGHVSHVLSDRLSSRPLGWVKTGADQMAKLRSFKANGGKVFPFILEQKKEELKEQRYSKIGRKSYKKIISKKANEQLSNVSVLNTGKVTPLLKLLRAYRGA